MRTLLLAAVAGCMFASSAQAEIVFRLKDVTFSDGAKASGGFITDDAATIISEFRITTDEGVFYPYGEMGWNPYPVSSFSYNNETVDASIISEDGFTRVSFGVRGDPEFGRGLSFRFGTPSSAVEKSIRGYESEFIFSRDIESGTVFASQGVVGPANPGDGGPIAGAVPEPSTWAMMIGGFGLIGSTMRRRKTTGATRVRLA